MSPRLAEHQQIVLIDIASQRRSRSQHLNSAGVCECEKKPSSPRHTPGLPLSAGKSTRRFFAGLASPFSVFITRNFSGDATMKKMQNHKSLTFIASTLALAICAANAQATES
ncbi:MAG: hypothetical protein ABW049_06755, partial [Spongiibacteraceae bacterium]